jgi:phosphotransferase family enzyme
VSPSSPPRPASERAARVAVAVEAAVAVARRLGLPAETPRVLGEHSNVLVHLAPAPVVARVPLTTTAVRVGPAWLGRELAVVRFLAGRGVPVVPPAETIDPGPHEHAGQWLVFWQLVEPCGQVDPVGAGRSLRRLHGVLAEYDGGLLPFDPRPEVEAICRVVEHRNLGDAAARLRALAGRIAMPEARAQPLHGDAHVSNVLAPDRWLDFEDTCAGPVEWDLACLVASYHVFGEERRAGLTALEAYGDHDERLLDALVPWRVLYAAAWSYLDWALTGQPRPNGATRLAWLERRHG